MKLVVTLLLFSLIAACGSGSSGGGEPTNDTRVLDEHACLDGTWLAVSRNIKVNGTNYPVATDRIFVVVSGQSNISHLTGISDLQTSYAGDGLRSWTSKNGMTEDVHAGRWAATFDNNGDTVKGSLVIQDACRTTYSGDVQEDALPQCTSSRLFERNTQVTLDCSGDVGLMTMENSKASINYQRLSENMELTSFSDVNNDHPVEPDAEPPLQVELLEPEEITEIVEEDLNNENNNNPDEELTEEEIEEILDAIEEEVEEEDPNPLTPDDFSDPVDPPPVDDIDPAEPPAPREVDSDNDGVNDDEDAFPNDPSEQSDSDTDGVGDNADAFPFDASESSDFDNDSIGDNADSDDDNDGVSDVLDAFQYDPEETLDTDGDGIGNNADMDDDGDFVFDNNDAFPLNSNEWSDNDADLIGDNADTDDDNDGLPDTVELVMGTNPLLFDTDADLVGDGDDAFPLDNTESHDADGDGVGDNGDAFPNDANEHTDSDGDGVGDNSDAFPNDANEHTDSDGDGVGDNSDAFPNDANEHTDSDGDGVGDNSDAFPNDANEHTDSDGDGVGDNSDAFPNDANEHTDSDGDGVGDNSDAFPNDANEQSDSDGDGVGDNADAFPNDANEHTDSDGDGVGDNSDAFPNDANEHTDSDGDGVGDNSDAFPYDANEQSDSDGDSVGDNSDAFPYDANEQSDSDGDGVGDNADLFPFNAGESSDNDGDGIGDNSDLDDDNDGVLDVDDPAPFDDTIPGEPEPVEPFAIQDFQNFYTGQSWYLTDFDLPDDATRSDYITDEGEILFDIRWTKRTRNLLADRLGYQRDEMTHELAALLCPPKIEVGKASVYGVGEYSNMIAELDSDLYHCNISGNEPANVRIRSFIPTKVGYQYAVTAQYQMRDYNMPNNAYRHFVMRFGRTAEHFDPVFNEFSEARIDIVATHKFSRLVLRDNGLPDSYGILVDDIQVSELGKVDHYDDCAALFAENSKGFRKCIAGEVDTEQSCSMEDLMVNKYQPGPNVPADRQLTDNAFVLEPAIQGRINFLSLGKKGKLKVSCYLDGYLATYPIFNKKLSLREISWGNATPESYPEQARISVQLSHCEDDNLNGVNHLGLVSTNETFTYDFTENDEGQTYDDCRLKKLIVKDKTPSSSPSTDGFDLNSINIEDLNI